MSAQEILAELPHLSAEERALVAKELHLLATGAETHGSPPTGNTRRAGLHAGAWEVAADFDAPLPDGFWLGEDA